MNRKMSALATVLVQTVLLSLAALSVLGAFLGPARTGAAVFSPVGLVAGAAMIALLLTGAVISLVRRMGWSVPALSLGAALVLAGGLTGSEPVLRRRAARGDGGPREGYLLLDGTGPRSVLARVTGGLPGAMPFALEIDSFEEEYYPAADIERLPPGRRPAKPPLRSYTARVRITDGETERSGVIGANRPLHNHGYHIYLHSYDMTNGGDIVLYVKSSHGLTLVYAGLLLLALGACGLGWGGSLPGGRFSE